MAARQILDLQVVIQIRLGQHGKELWQTLGVCARLYVVHNITVLLREVNKLYDSIFISREYLDNLGLYDFIEERKLLNHQQFQNNQKFQNQ